MSVYHTYSEEQLIAFLRTGDHAAFTEIYHRYWEILADAAYQRLHSREDAEEVVQEVFVGLYTGREQLNPKSTLEAYLKTAIKNKVINAWRHQQMYYRHLDNLIGEYQLSPPPTPEGQTELRELKSTVLAAAEKLPEKCRDVFLMSRVDQLSHREIAEKTGIAEATVRKHIQKALRILRDEFRDNQYDLMLVGMLIFLR
ncbi:MAG TPA: RNA polymerase sigma-70 factor [Mucilaginibacter sp.]|nr:RNA polymerase sigma-70 factor [Mucilaginibacter sp.]